MNSLSLHPNQPPPRSMHRHKTHPDQHSSKPTTHPCKSTQVMEYAHGAGLSNRGAAIDVHKGKLAKGGRGLQRRPICTCAHVIFFVYVCVCARASAFERMHKSMCVMDGCIYAQCVVRAACVCSCVRVCVHACLRVCSYVFMSCVCMYVFVFAHARMRLSDCAVFFTGKFDADILEVFAADLQRKTHLTGQGMCGISVQRSRAEPAQGWGDAHVWADAQSSTHLLCDAFDVEISELDARHPSRRCRHGTT